MIPKATSSPPLRITATFVSGLAIASALDEVARHRGDLLSLPGRGEVNRRVDRHGGKRVVALFRHGQHSK